MEVYKINLKKIKIRPKKQQKTNAIWHVQENLI